MGIPTEVAVCQQHAEKLAEPYAEWMYDFSKDPVTDDYHGSVLMGETLQELDEYILVARPDTVKVHTPTGRIFSHEDHNGYHIPVRVRRRGSEDYKQLTLVIPRHTLPSVVDLLKKWAP